MVRIRHAASLVFLVVLAINTMACSRIKSYFPDKEKDYQFTTEIADLQLPADLQDHAIKEKPLIVEPDFETTESLQVPSSERSTKTRFIPVELVEFDGGATRLRIEEPIEKAWRYVGKALSRHSIEIIDRNNEQLVYVVQYDPGAKTVEDGALWDELVFFFGDDPAKEKEFHIRVSEKNRRMTEVIVLDAKDTPVSKGVGLSLLNLLKDSINQDLSKQ